MSSAANGPLIHIHGVSVGEVFSAAPIVQGLLAALPDCRILLTSWTKSSQTLLHSLYDGNERVTVDRLPFDLPWNHAAFYRRHDVKAALWIDSEIWPGWLMAMDKRGIKAGLINARMSERSFGRWKRVPAVIAKILGWFDRIDAQSEFDARHFRDLGAANVQVQPVNMKYMRPALAVEDAELAQLRAVLGGVRPSIGFVSTHPGDEVLAFAVHQTLKTTHPDLLTVIVPRHIDRVPELQTAASHASLKAARRSDPATHAPDCDIFLGDTIGEMGLYLSLAPVIVMGKSFDAHHPGGQNPIEAGQLGRAIVCGPYMTNFPGLMEDFRKAEAIIEVEPSGLSATLAHLLDNPDYMDVYGKRARNLCSARYKMGPAYIAELADYIRQAVAA